jgi:hypothetical protein
VRRQLSHRSKKVFAVVNQQERLARAQVLDELRRDGVIAVWCEAKGGDQRGAYEGRVGDRGEIDPEHPIGKGVRDILGNRQGQPRLAHATRAGERQEGHGLIQQQSASSGKLRLPANEASPRNGERAERSCRVRVGHRPCPTEQTDGAHSVPDSKNADVSRNVVGPGTGVTGTGFKNGWEVRRHWRPTRGFCVLVAKSSSSSTR